MKASNCKLGTLARFGLLIGAKSYWVTLVSLAVAFLAFVAHSDTITLNPVADSYIWQNSPGGNFGSASVIFAGGTATMGIRRALMRFDPSGQVPAGAVVNSVTLGIDVTKENPSTPANSNFGLHRIFESWSESQVTWSSRLSGTPWNAPGASDARDAAFAPSTTVFISGQGPYTFPSSPALIADVQSWINNPSTNFGWLLISESEGTPYTARQFASREDNANAPTLIIGYSLPPPTILTQPSNQTVFVGSTVAFSVAASGAPPLAYQWQFGSGAIAGATNASLVLNNVQTNQSGLYSVLVSNSNGATNSQPATLAVKPLPPGLPFVNIIAPTNGAAYPAGASVGLAAEAHETNGTIVQVEFFLGPNSAGVATNAPYSVLLTNVSAGTYALTAVATDALGTNGTSTAVTFFVRRPPLVALSVTPEVAKLGTTITNLALVQTDGTTVTNVKFFEGSALLGQAGPPYQLVWQPPTAGIYTLTAYARDDLGQSGTSDPVTLRIFIPDSTQPGIALVTAPQNYTRTTSPTVMLSGTASDNVGLDHVEYHVDSGPYLATLGNVYPVPGTTNWAGQFPITSTNWTAVVPLFPGNNAVRLRSVDFAGNASSEVTSFLTYVVTGTLTVRTQGVGTLSPDRNGQVLELGQTYPLTAQPGPNQIFAGWDSVANSNSASLTVLANSNSTAVNFLMVSNLVLTANFTTNPFPSLAGIYTGSFFDSSHPSPGSFGSVSLQLSGLGSFSGNLNPAGASYSFSSQFDARGKALFSILRQGQTPIAVAMQLDLSEVAGQITGFVTNVVGTDIFASRLIAELNGFARPAVGITRHGGGSLTLSIFGIPGSQYVVQRSSDLATWNNIYTNAVAADGSFLFTNMPSTSPAFYRTRQE